MDVRSIQEALKADGLYKGMVDGIAGTQTRAAVKAFQAKNDLLVDGIAGPDTLRILFPDKPIVVPPPVGATLSEGRLRRLWPHAKPEIVSGIAAAAGTVLPLHGLTSIKRLVHFMAQVSHECGGGTIAEENLYYSAKRMTQVWPSRYPTIAAAAPYAQNPRALANKTYGGRMGNRPGTDDGWNYRGRGLIQITGRDGYAQVGKIAGLDLVGNPALANEAHNLLLVAASFWTWKGLNAKADAGLTEAALVACTRAVNGGTNGLADRKVWFSRWRNDFGV